MINSQFFRSALQGLEEAWREGGWPIADHLAPGASEEHLAEIESKLGYPIPPEVREWWSWHDGATRLQPGTTLGRETQIGAGAWEFLSSAEALAERDFRYAAIPAPDEEPTPSWGWRTSWLPILRFDANCVFVDCLQVTPVGTVPLRLYSHVPEDVFTPQFGCFLYGVLTWTHVLQERYYYWDPANGGPMDRYKEMPLVLRLLV